MYTQLDPQDFSAIMVQSYSDISQEENVLKFYLCKSMIKEEEFATKPNKKIQVLKNRECCNYANRKLLQKGSLASFHLHVNSILSNILHLGKK